MQTARNTKLCVHGFSLMVLGKPAAEKPQQAEHVEQRPPGDVLRLERSIHWNSAVLFVPAHLAQRKSGVKPA